MSRRKSNPFNRSDVELQLRADGWADWHLNDLRIALGALTNMVRTLNPFAAYTMARALDVGPCALPYHMGYEQPVDALAIDCTVPATYAASVVPSQIRTPYGTRHVVRRTNDGAYYFTTPTPSAPHGEWWTFNQQRGFVPVPSNGRALKASLFSDSANGGAS